MIPVSLDPRALNLGLAGHGPAALRRWQLIAEGGAMQAQCFADAPDAALQASAGEACRLGLPDEETLSRLDVLWIVGMPDDEAAALAQRARRHKILVNVEDRREHCTFHNAAEVRRGALLLTVSTDGRSPGLAQRIRGFLAQTFGPEWGERLEMIGNQRDEWRRGGDDLPVLAAKTETFLQQNGWLAELTPHRK
ncbi:siroheme synthase [Acidisoma cellulosilytica]|uniref:precorrin-2 dehydrogenase n=1 Tax=Acidisoma cellulosilyticum TaxID=2802395 RepID=A0A963YXY4_9PROT|nr:NAD(P)-dependent oxidoreductase [Acidisoma cellulosilyticum]MCB8879231.1 siroheme synthase [Acidisoma cellulosilyticum]